MNKLVENANFVITMEKLNEITLSLHKFKLISFECLNIIYIYIYISCQIDKKYKNEGSKQY